MNAPGFVPRASPGHRRACSTPRSGFYPVAAFFLAVAVASGPAPGAPPAVCGPHRESVDIPPALFLPNDIPYMGDSITQEVTLDVRSRGNGACGRRYYTVREIAFETSFDDLRREYLRWLETHLTGLDPLHSEYVRRHGVIVVDRPGEFRFIDTVKPEPDHQGRLEIHLTEERDASSRCRQSLLRYTALGAACESDQAQPR